ncbi:MAG: NfeD family protein [Phycisphaeraceae bacterium]|nr:NfeD family protein [Phycisphaeraceae bacterium]
MIDLLFTGSAVWFTIPALVGTVVFALRLGLMLIGGGGADLGDVDISDAHGDPGKAFEVLSIQSATAFAMGFGWAGLASLKGFGWSMPTSLLLAAVGGAAMVWLLAVLLKGMYDLEASGNVAIGNAIGHEGDVYATVPARGEGRGQVRVVLDQRQRTYTATTEGEELPTGTRVRVTRVNEDNTLTVARAG